MSLGEVEDTGPQPNDDPRDDEPAIKRAKVADERGDDEGPARNGRQDETGRDDIHSRRHSHGRNGRSGPGSVGSQGLNYSDHEGGEQRGSWDRRESTNREERRERNEQGRSHSRRPSPVAEPSARDAPNRRKVSVSQEERKRGQRLFGGLLSALSQPAKRSAPQAHRRQEPEQQQQQPEKRESREEKQQQAERVAKLATARKIEQIKFDERVMLARHSNLLALARNLQTRSEPKLYYRPWELSKHQEQIIEDQILAAEENIERETSEFARQKRERLAVLGVVASSPPHEPEVTTSAAKTEVEDKATADGPTTAASKEPEDQEPAPPLPSVMSPLHPVSDEKDDQAEEAEEPEHHDDQTHRHDHDDRDRDIMVETEEDTALIFALCELLSSLKRAAPAGRSAERGGVWPLPVAAVVSGLYSAATGSPVSDFSGGHSERLPVSLLTDRSAIDLLYTSNTINVTSSPDPHIHSDKIAGLSPRNAAAGKPEDELDLPVSSIRRDSFCQARTPNTYNTPIRRTSKTHIPIMAIIDRLRGILPAKAAEEREYAPLNGGPLALVGEDENGYATSSLLEGSGEDIETENEAVFSWMEYSIFAIIGVAMLWAWNMFLAAAPYFQMRFATDPWALANFQSTITSVSTGTNLAAMLVLTNIQYSASYPFRINSALVINVAVFGLLTASTSLFLHVSPTVYLAFLLLMVSAAAWACGLIQNGAFAFAASFGRPEYTQAIMAGQAVAGVLPPIAQMVSVLAFAPSGGPPGGPPPKLVSATSNDVISNQDAIAAAGTSAFFYFLTAVTISVVALAAFQPLVRRHHRLVEARMVEALSESMASIEEAERTARKVIGMKALFRKLHWVALTVFMCFLITMFFPVFTPKVLSVTTPRSPASSTSPDAAQPPPMSQQPRLLQPSAFIPLAFFFWNLGDLLGRMSTMLPMATRLRQRPVVLFVPSVARLAFLPLYLLCNLGGRGASVNSDLFYLFCVQLPFGLSSGFLSSSAMMAAGEWVSDGEQEAAGGFMGLCLVAGLTVGSLLSFTVARI
ncbi:nucleoside transporter family [Grosmannia clavigera kw1407]|uniref:Nucleoside transporter family n=1 Tax=Grosmannia clavigera (strain kw1407 / UAMH 11150) TaxID=655863 RepID=F0XSI6_GROCL|nr:nucleoside transporter family [Grosmannia clavigera kw1407]EFW99377.1 nucleoside transporter family [Grosmannia clavigera kw1407]